MIGGTSGDATGRWDPVSIAVSIDPLRANRIPCDRAVLCALVLLTGCDVVGLHEPIIVLLLKSGEDVLAQASVRKCTWALSRDDRELCLPRERWKSLSHTERR
jgi:hypothetical protein